MLRTRVFAVSAAVATIPGGCPRSMEVSAAAFGKASFAVQITDKATGNQVAADCVQGHDAPNERWAVNAPGSYVIHQLNFDGGGRCRTTLIAEGISTQSDVPMPRDMEVTGPFQLAAWTCDNCKRGTNQCAGASAEMRCRGSQVIQPTWTFPP